MSAEENKAAVRRFFEQAWNQGDVSKADHHAHPLQAGGPHARHSHHGQRSSG